MYETDVVIVGAGIFGLSIAYALQQQGINVCVLEKGSGKNNNDNNRASHTVLGALMPHVPDQWNAKKQFQFDALRTLPVHVNKLEEAGIDTQYRQSGRLIPLRDTNDLAYAKKRQLQSIDNWQSMQTGYTFCVHSCDTAGLADTWISSDVIHNGYVLDTLAASINARAYLDALALNIGHSNIINSEQFSSYDDLTRTTTCVSGNCYRGHATVLCGGYQTFDLLKPYYPDYVMGNGIKGQASLLRLAKPLDLPLPPILYSNNIYIIAHSRHICAVGTTSENEWDDTIPNKPTYDNPAYLQKAYELCPALAEARLIQHWAGVRPRARRRDPMIGKVDGTQNLYIATGGFKISLGIAHRIAQSVVDNVLQQPATVALPESFKLSSRFTSV